jgi:hypothetical protein
MARGHVNRLTAQNLQREIDQQTIAELDGIVEADQHALRAELMARIGECLLARETRGGVFTFWLRQRALRGAARCGGDERVHATGGECDERGGLESRDHAAWHLHVQPLQKIGRGRGAEFHARQKKDRGRIRQRGEFCSVLEVARQGFDALLRKRLAIPQRAKSRYGDHSIVATGPLQRSL